MGIPSPQLGISYIPTNLCVLLEPDRVKSGFLTHCLKFRVAPDTHKCSVLEQYLTNSSIASRQ